MLVKIDTDIVTTDRSRSRSGSPRRHDETRINVITNIRDRNDSFAGAVVQDGKVVTINHRILLISALF